MRSGIVLVHFNIFLNSNVYRLSSLVHNFCLDVVCTYFLQLFHPLHEVVFFNKIFLTYIKTHFPEFLLLTFLEEGQEGS